jgi:hypothetical protein
MESGVAKVYSSRSACDCVPVVLRQLDRRQSVEGWSRIALAGL